MTSERELLPRDLISQSDFARVLKISRQAVYQAKRKGSIGMQGSNVDLTSPDTQVFIRDAKERLGDRMKDLEEQGIARTRLSEQAKEVLQKGGRKFKERSKELRKIVKTAVPVKLEAEAKDEKQLKRELLIQRRIALEVKTAQVRGTLIDREVIERFLGQMMAIDTSQLTTLPQKLSASVAAAFGSSDSEARVKAEEVLQKEIYAVLDVKQRKLTEFLEGLDKQ